jgi:diaminopimelate epimerase
MTKPPTWKRRDAAPLSEFVADLVAPALARQGLGETGLVADWPEIVGARIARSCRPIEIQWPPRASKRDPDAPIAPATLVLRVEGAFALEIQHSAATIVERVNAHLGWRCIGKIAFRQGPLDAAPKRAAKASPPSARAKALAEGYAAPIEAEELREAVTRLGARVIDRSGAAGRGEAAGVGEISSVETKARRRIAKMNGAGNKIDVIDLRGLEGGVTAGEARAIHAMPGLAFDQLMVLTDPHRAGTAAYVRIYNNDGSESAACGNGTRCVAYLLMRDGERRELSVETQAGVLECRRMGEFSFSVDMGAPRLGWDEIPLASLVADTRRVDLGGAAADLSVASTVSMGNPHAIFWVEDIAAHDLAALGPVIEHHPMFPQKANISLAEIVARDHIRLRVWERGVGLTAACGSAACAALVAAVRDDLSERRARVSLPGGDLTIEWRESDGHVLMTGPVELEGETMVDL